LAALDKASLRTAGVEGDSVGELFNVSPCDDFVIGVFESEGSKFTSLRKLAINSAVFRNKAATLSVKVRAKEATGKKNKVGIEKTEAENCKRAL